MGESQLKRGKYTIGWICALPLEQTAAMLMLDERHEDLNIPANDENTYTLGKIGGHNVVIVGLPTGRIGTNDSAAVITRMASTFPNIKFGMMVGVGGGIPYKTRLGDVVICSAVGQSSGVVQHDMGTHTGGQFKTRGFLSGPPTAVLTALTKFQADPRTPTRMRDHLSKMEAMPDIDESYLKSDDLEDILFEADYRHVEGKDCNGCDKSRVVQRPPRRGGVKVHYGLIASGNTKVKDTKIRDELCKRYNDDLFCIEMEAAGLMNNFPCVVIRGICDYADSHANDKWQKYAAAVAAVCTKTFLGVVPERDFHGLQSVQEVASSSTRTSREYDMRHQANSPPPSPQKFESNTAPAPLMIGGPSANYYSNPSGTAYPRLGEPQYNANDFIRPFGEAIANFIQGGSRRAQVTEETSDPPQTPPRSPMRNNPGHPRHPEGGSSLERRNTDSGQTQPLLGGNLSDLPITGVKKKRSYTFPNTDPAALFKAIKAGDFATIQKELKNGAALEVTDEIGFTPLWRAVDIGQRNVIQLLLDGGANYEANFNGQNILDWALKKGEQDIVNMVLAKMDENLRLDENTTRQVN